MARRRIEVSDVVEVLVHWQARRSLKQIARSTGMAGSTSLVGKVAVWPP